LQWPIRANMKAIQICNLLGRIWDTHILRSAFGAAATWAYEHCFSRANTGGRIVLLAYLCISAMETPPARKHSCNVHVSCPYCVAVLPSAQTLRAVLASNYAGSRRYG